MKDLPDTGTKTTNEQLAAPQSLEPARESVPMVKPRVVIVGAGFGGLNAARALHDAPVEVTVIDRNNHHLFQPLLYQVATGVLSPAEISAPIRSVLSKQKNAEVLMGEVTGVDTQAKLVLLHDQSVPYDYLILATGARDSYFGHNDWAQFAPGLKSIVQATPFDARSCWPLRWLNGRRTPRSAKGCSRLCWWAPVRRESRWPGPLVAWPTKPWSRIFAISIPRKRGLSWWRPCRAFS